MHLGPCVLVILALFFSGVGACAQSPYLDDFEFLRKTVAQHGASVGPKKIDWKGLCAAARPRFAACANDRDHVAAVMALLAGLQDSHTGVTRSRVPWKELPSKWDGLYGGGLWFAWEDGRIMLRGIMKGHAHEGRLKPGYALATIAGQPAWFVMEMERHRIARHAGVSSDHSLFHSLGNRFLPFGERQELELGFVTPEGKGVTAKVRRWGPGGKTFYPMDVQLPEGVSRAPGATAKMLTTPWCEKVGYLRITGSMDAATTKAFFAAFDGLKGMEALLLDCRGMGGGGDAAAWKMAGRLFNQAVANGPGRRLEPTGSWQFTGPVVMLQDEGEVSSAETFTWAVSETRRVLSFGRPTGGWGIIPKAYKCPSGLLDFRLGVNDRKTPITGTRTEGVGWPPDLLIPYGPAFLDGSDVTRALGLEALRLLHGGVARKKLVKAFGDLLGGRVKAFERVARKWKVEAWTDRVRRDLRQTLKVEAALLSPSNLPVPDAAGLARRASALGPRLKAARIKDTLGPVQKRLRTEAKAQAEWRRLLRAGAFDEGGNSGPFFKRHGKRRIGQLMRDWMKR